MRRKNLYGVIALFLALSGCSFVPGLQSIDEHFYQIPPAPEPPPHAHVNNARLAVKETRADLLVNSKRIIFSEDGIEQGFYQYATWAEPPPKRFTTLLLLALDQSKIFDSVSLLGASALGNYQLNTEMLEFYHNTSTKPGIARVKIRVELVEALTRKAVAQTIFEKQIELKSYDARGAVDALTEALHGVIADIVDWLAKQNYALAATP